MGRCRSMRSWTSVFRTGVGVFLLGLTLVQSVSPQTACPAGVTLQNLPQPQYHDTPEVEEDVGFMSNVVQSFLSTVQPNPFPEALIQQFVKNFEQKKGYEEYRDVIKKALRYEVGFLVCAAIGILYIIVMPLVGFILACCRCCGNCGGRMYQKQTSSTRCRRRALYWCLFITSVIILAGNICMFKSNEVIRVSVDQGSAELNDTFENLHTFLTAVPQQVNQVVNESYKTVNEVTENLNAIGPQLGAEIQNRFRGTLDPALNSVRLMHEDTMKTDTQLKKINTSLVWLQATTDLIQNNVSIVKDQISQTISNPACMTCSSLNTELQKLTLDISISTPTLSDFQSAVDNVIKADLPSTINKVKAYFSSIPQIVTNDTKDVVQNAKQQLDDIKNQISRLTNDIPLSALTEVSADVSQIQQDVNKYTPQVERAEHVRWSICVAISCVVLLVLVCNTLGLILGPLGLEPQADPTERSRTADCGGTFLIMGVGFSFIFCWLFMLVVLVLFLVSGNVSTLVCRPWNNGKLLKFLDTPGLIPAFDLNSKLGLNTNVTLSGIYSDCEKNEPLWSTLRLYKNINLQELLNVSKYTEEVKKHFENVDISLSKLTFLSAEDEQQLSSVSDRAKDVDFTLVSQQISDAYSINLNSTADRLDNLVQFQNIPQLKKELRDEANELRRIQASIEITIFPQLERLNRSLETLRSFTETLSRAAAAVLTNVKEAQNFLDTKTKDIIKAESRRFLDCQMSYFSAYARWANVTITEQVGRCGPVAGAVDSAEIVLCSRVVASVNAFWFSLGWCMIFFIFSIVFSVKLSKYYRRMRHTDMSDNHIVMHRFPQIHVKTH